MANFCLTELQISLAVSPVSAAGSRRLTGANDATENFDSKNLRIKVGLQLFISRVFSSLHDRIRPIRVSGGERGQTIVSVVVSSG